MNAHPLDVGSAGLRDRLSPRVVTLVADTNPIDGRQHNRPLLFGLQYNSAGGERVVDPLHRWHERIAKRRPNRRRHVDVERRNAKLDGKTRLVANAKKTDEE